MFKKIRAPSGLSKESQKWWRKIVDEYEIEDQAGHLILLNLCEVFDRMRKAQKILESEGMTVKDRFNQIKSHPLLSVERDARTHVLQYLKALNCDLEPLKTTLGRPPGG